MLIFSGSLSNVPGAFEYRYFCKIQTNILHKFATIRQQILIHIKWAPAAMNACHATISTAYWPMPTYIPGTHGAEKEINTEKEKRPTVV